jgi:thymidylate synthase (FAD)
MSLVTLAPRVATILTAAPTVVPIAEMEIDWDGVAQMAEWVRSHRPECLPDDFDSRPTNYDRAITLFTHGGQRAKDKPPSKDAERAQERVQELMERWEEGALTDNEMLVELAGRKCYDSFGRKVGRSSNADFIANTQKGDVPHASIMYHAKMSFFIAGVSRRVSHELIRNYVGADRDEEGSPSQESTRYTHHYGFYVAHPYLLREGGVPDGGVRRFELDKFRSAMQSNYDEYVDYINRQVEAFTKERGEEPKGIERKRIYESASPYLSHACETSWIWTTNPIALAKMFRERDNDGADLEFRRLAKVWKKACVERWPNLFPQPWMRE